MKFHAYHSLEYLQDMLAGIYGKRNAKLYSSTDLLLHIFEEASVVAETMRKEDNGKIEHDMAVLFAWVLTFCNSRKINLARAVFGKYSGICPYCKRKENCVCISVEAKPKRFRCVE